MDHEVGLGWHCKAEWLLHLYPCSYEQLIAMPPRFRIASLLSFSLTLVHSLSDYCKHSYLYEPTLVGITPGNNPGPTCAPVGITPGNNPGPTGGRF